MMRYLLMFVVSISLFHHSEGAISRSTENFHSEHPGKCVYKANDEQLLVLEDGEKKSPPKECLEVSCSVSSDKFSLEITSCGKVGAPTGYKAVFDSKSPYPGCCKASFVPL